MPSGHKIDWSKYDNLILEYLPRMTISEFTRLYLKDISPKAVGARARKLKVEPARYKPTNNHKKKIAKTIGKETEEMVSRIRAMRDTHSRKEISTELGISLATLARIINAHRIKLSDDGIIRARQATIEKQKGKVPWNKGKKLPSEMVEKIAKARQRQSGRISQIQLTMYRILDELGVNYCREENEKCRFGHWTFDCRIIDNDVDLLIEVQGDYIHSLPKNVLKDEAKATYMRRYFPQIPIKYVWEHEFGAINRIKSRVLEWLGRKKVKTVKFNFSDIEVRLADVKEARLFVAAFHYLEKMIGKHIIGAYLGDKLIGVSVWGRPSRHETARTIGSKVTSCLELRRFVIHDSYHKKNFASWFLSRSETLLPEHIDALVSFADSAIGHVGTIYKATGWEFHGETTSSYFYVDEDGYVMHKKTLYNRARSMHMVERDFAETYNYSKVATPPKLRYVKRIKPGM